MLAIALGNNIPFGAKTLSEALLLVEEAMLAVEESALESDSDLRDSLRVKSDGLKMLNVEEENGEDEVGTAAVEFAGAEEESRAML